MAKKAHPSKKAYPSKNAPSSASKPVQGKMKQTSKKGISPSVALFLIGAAVVVAGCIVYWPSLSNAFTNWDDPGYLTQNYDIRNWSKSGISHLFHSYAMGNYHPITMLSFALEYHIAALNPFIYHRDSLTLHLLASLAVTWLAWLLTKNLTITTLCGLLFVIHPMHVESVAWVAGRKDVLFGMFYFFALIAYYYYASLKKNKLLFYALCLLFFVLSLLSKAVAVTLPVSCLLIDYLIKRPLKIRLLLEKIPFFVLSIVFGIVSIKAQQSVAAIQSPNTSPIFDRIFFASYSFLAYIGKLVLPIDLCNFYPYPVPSNGYFPMIWYIYPFMVLALLFVVYRCARKNRDILFGFLFYATAIFLLLQLLPVGTAIIADRYSYVAYFGLFFVVGYFYDRAMHGIPSWIKSFKGALPFIVTGWLIWLGMTTRARCAVWKNTETLWRDAIEKQPDMSKAYNNLGFELYTQGKYDEAVPLFAKAIELTPTFALPYSNRGEIYRIEGKNALALADFNKAIALDPSSAGSFLSRAILYSIKDKLDSAGRDFDMALKLNPNMAEAYCSRGNYDDMRNQYDAAIADYTKALTLKPDMAEAYENRGEELIKHNHLDAGIADLNTFLQLKPESGEGYMKRSSAYYDKKDYKDALSDANQAKSLGFAVDATYLQGLKKLAGE